MYLVMVSGFRDRGRSLGSRPEENVQEDPHAISSSWAGGSVSTSSSKSGGDVSTSSSTSGGSGVFGELENYYDTTFSFNSVLKLNYCSGF